MRANVTTLNPKPLNLKPQVRMRANITTEALDAIRRLRWAIDNPSQGVCVRAVHVCLCLRALRVVRCSCLSRGAGLRVLHMRLMITVLHALCCLALSMPCGDARRSTLDARYA